MNEVPQYEYLGEVLELTPSKFHDRPSRVLVESCEEVEEYSVDSLSGIDYGDELYMVYVDDELASHIIPEPSCLECKHRLFRGDEEMICPNCDSRYALGDPIGERKGFVKDMMTKLSR